MACIDDHSRIAPEPQNMEAFEELPLEDLSEANLLVPGPVLINNEELTYNNVQQHQRYETLSQSIDTIDSAEILLPVSQIVRLANSNDTETCVFDSVLGVLGDSGGGSHIRSNSVQQSRRPGEENLVDSTETLGGSLVVDNGDVSIADEVPSLSDEDDQRANLEVHHELVLDIGPDELMSSENDKFGSSWPRAAARFSVWWFLLPATLFGIFLVAGVHHRLTTHLSESLEFDQNEESSSNNASNSKPFASPPSDGLVANNHSSFESFALPKEPETDNYGTASTFGDAMEENSATRQLPSTSAMVPDVVVDFENQLYTSLVDSKCLLLDEDASSSNDGQNGWKQSWVWKVLLVTSTTACGMCVIAMQIGERVHETSTESPLSTGMEEVCTKGQLTSYVGLKQFQADFRPTQKGRRSKTLAALKLGWDPINYHQLTNLELRMILLGFGLRSRLSSLTKGVLIECVTVLYARTLRTFTNEQIRDLLRTKGVYFKSNSRKRELVLVALQAGF